MIRYTFSSYAPSGVSADVAGPELERIRAVHKGELRPHDVIEVSRDPDAPLHPAFEWRDDVAGEQWRVHQARNLIRSVQIIHEDKPPAKAYFPVALGNGEGRYYQSATAMTRAEVESARMLFESKLLSLQHSYGQLLKAVEAEQPEQAENIRGWGNHIQRLVETVKGAAC